MNVADVIVEELEARGVPFVATLNGHGLDPLHLACRRAGMRVIDVRNEQAASYMAEVTGRLSRAVGVCAVSGAVAHANALTGVLNAHLDGAPMLLITGITPLSRLGAGDFQDFDPVPMTAPICKYARLLDAPALAAQIVHEAFAAATSGRPGPVHLSLPIDVAETEVDADRIPRARVRSGRVRIDGAASETQIDELVRALGEADRPLLVAGSGVYYAGGEAALARFVAQQQIPTVVPIWDRGSVARPMAEFVGVIGAASGGARILADADLLLLLGAEVDYRVGQLSAPAVSADARVIRVDADAARLRAGIEADVSITASPAVVLDQLAAACREHGTPACAPWLAEARERRERQRQRCLAHADALPPGINGRDVVAAIADVITSDALVMVDGGNIGQWFHQMLTDRLPGDWVTCGASGVIGWGLPGAMAARALHPDRPVILLSGDGSFTFTVAELECAARQGLNLVAVVADDERWGISVTVHEQQYGQALYSMLGPTRLDRVAEGFGCRGLRITERAALAPALREALVADRPVVLHVPIVASSPGGEARE